MNVRFSLRSEGKKRMETQMAKASDNSQRLNVGVTIGAILSAFLASLCCFGPVLLTVLGIGGMGFIHKFTVLRPYITVLMLGFLGVGFYLTYRKRPEVCESEQACANPGAKKINKIVLWVATGLIISFWAFPYYARYVLP